MTDDRQEQRKRAAEFWDESHGADALDSFLDHPLIEAYISLRAFGEMRSHMDVAIDEIASRTRPGSHVLSVGCGTAAKEIAIAQALPDRHFLGIDIARKTLERARKEAVQEGVSNLTLETGNFNALTLDADSFDVILGLGAIHHIEELENFWQQCCHGLNPGGAVIAQEYIGPNRFQWTSLQIEHGNRILNEILPEQHKVHHTSIVPVDLDELISIDPSEAVRSEEIVATCESSELQIESYRGTGCSLLQPVLSYQLDTFDPGNWEHNHLLMTLFREEDRLMREQKLPDAFGMLIAVN